MVLFGFGRETKAIDISNKNCGTPPDGSRYAIFVLSENDEYEWSNEGGLKKLEPKEITGEPLCVLVKINQLTIDIDGLVEQNILPSSIKDNDFEYEEIFNGYYGQGDDFVDFENKTLSFNIFDSAFDLRRTTDSADDIERIKTTYLRGLIGYEMGFRIRYNFKDDQRKYWSFYFMGFANPDASGAITAIPKEKCWEMDGDKILCDKKYPDQCFWHEISTKHKCQSRLDPAICEKLPINFCGTKAGSQACQWNTVKKECLTILKESIEQAYPVPAGYNGPIPPCAFSGSCHDTNDIVQLVVNFVANILLPFVGGAVFIMFVYGGFTIILSFGNPEKVKKGWGILIAALVGMGIVFGAYLLLDFVFTSLNISAGFRGFGR